MLLTPAGGNRFEAVGPNTGTSKGVDVTSDASADTYGSYAELVAATDHDANWLTVHICDAGTKAYFALDVAVGAVSSEQTVIEKFRFFVTTAQGTSFTLPVFVPAGSRLSARLMDSTTSARTVSVAAYLAWTDAVTPGARIELLDDGGASQGMNVASSATANTKGSWTAFSSNTGFDYRWLFLAAQPFDSAPTSAIGQLLDVGVGAASSEQVVIPNLFFHLETASTDALYPPVTALFPVSIPENTRIALRQQSESGAFVDSYTVSYSLYGIG